MFVQRDATFELFLRVFSGWFSILTQYVCLYAFTERLVLPKLTRMFTAEYIRNAAQRLKSLRKGRAL